MRSEMFTCDVCQKVRGEANHWFLARISAKWSLIVSPWAEPLMREEGAMHLCGEACVLRRVSEFLSAK